MRRPSLLLVVIGALLLATAGGSATWVVRAARASMIQQVRAGEQLAAAERAGALGHLLDDARTRLRVNVNSALAANAVAAGHGGLLQPGVENALGLPGVIGVAITDVDGHVLATAGQPPVHQGHAGLRFDARDERRRGVVTVGVEIRSPDGALVGWADEAIDLARMSPQLEQPFAEFRGATSLVTRDGRIVMSTVPSTATTVQSPEVRELLATAGTGSVRFHSARFDTERIAALHAVGGTDLVVVVSADTEAAYAPADRIARRLGTAFALTVLVAGLLTVAGLLVLRARRRRLEEEGQAAAELARTDPLTGLGNRRAFDAAVTGLSSSAGPASIILVDLDHLKTVNDVLGHAAGDAAIVGTAEAIRRVVRAGDCVARLGGDEFVVVLDGAPEARARELAAMIRASVAGVPVAGARGLSVSVGVASGVGRDIATMLLEADAALYAAKRDRRRGEALVLASA